MVFEQKSDLIFRVDMQLSSHQCIARGSLPEEPVEEGFFDLKTN
jgi:hypothetical protein